VTSVMKQQKPHVLIVDDETNVRRVLGTLLEQAGYVTSRAASAEQALEVVRSVDPDLVLTDLRMDGMSGMELLAQVRRSYPEIPVIVITAHGTVENAVASRVVSSTGTPCSGTPCSGTPCRGTP